MATGNPFQKAFVMGLLRWNEAENTRQMPWKGEKDPYKIWLSEIILQQTRVEQGLKYYQRFITTLPTINHLAKAPEQQVFKLWEGLGYYSRCRNLIATAKNIVQNFNSVFPATYKGVLSLKGVGPYTAAAITSFAYNASYAVVDGNVFRVLSRIFNIDLPIDSLEGKKFFAGLAQELLPPAKSGIYNQAIMDFGATICKPVPNCANCFFNARCNAFLQNKQSALPVKEKKGTVRQRWFYYFLLEHNGKVALHQRTAKDIWQNLYEPLLMEGTKKMQKRPLFDMLQQTVGINASQYTISGAAVQTTQRLTHQFIHFSFVHLRLFNSIELSHHQWVSKQELPYFPFPKTVKEFIAAAAI